MDFKQSYYSYPQFYQTYLNFEKVQREVTPSPPISNTNSLNPQNIKPNKFNSLSNPMTECIDHLNNPSKGIPHMDYLPKEYPPYYAPFETGTQTFTHRQFYTLSS